MKTLKKVISIALLAGFSTAITGNVIAANPKEPFAKERTDIRKDITNIKSDKKEIKMWKAKLKADRKECKRTAAIVDAKNLAKAKADLKRNKAYLKADKKDLARDHKEAIRNYRTFVKEDRKVLCDTRMALYKARSDGDYVAAKVYENTITKYENYLEADKLGLKAEKKYLNNDMIAINKEIRNSDALFTPVVSTEIAYAKTENWVMGY